MRRVMINDTGVYYYSHSHSGFFKTPVETEHPLERTKYWIEGEVYGQTFEYQKVDLEKGATGDIVVLRMPYNREVSTITLKEWKVLGKLKNSMLIEGIQI